MNVLVACEFSGTVRDAFRAKGHDAWSCDLRDDPSDSYYHIQDDVFRLLEEGMDGTPSHWDLIIAHPPCTHLCVTGNRHYAGTQLRIDAAEFVRKIWEYPCEKLCIENPVGVINSLLPEMPKPQYVQPWMFGHPTTKKTGLWKRGLPDLVPTDEVYDQIEWVEFPNGKRQTKWYYETSCLPHAEREYVRSITFQGLANAMAEQWG